MVYETFLNTIKEGAAQALGDGYELSLRRIPKNNGLVLDGLCISKTGSPVAPAIYLNTCYEQYLRGRPMERILGEILELYRNHETAPGLDCTNLLDFEAMKPRILLQNPDPLSDPTLFNCAYDLISLFPVEIPHSVNVLLKISVLQKTRQSILFKTGNRTGIHAQFLPVP